MMNTAEYFQLRFIIIFKVQTSRLLYEIYFHNFLFLIHNDFFPSVSHQFTRLISVILSFPLFPYLFRQNIFNKFRGQTFQEILK